MKKIPFVRILLLSVVLLATAGAATAKIVLHRITTSEEFKRFAEEKAGQYLKAKVSIGRIRPYHFNQIALENVILELPSVKGRPQLVSLDRLLFRYHWKQLWNQKYEEPAVVTVSNPSFVIGQDEFPYQYFEASGSGNSGLILPSLDFRGGEIRYLMTSLGKEIVLTDIIGKINQAEGTKVRIGIRATARGILSGLIAIHGTVDPVNKTHDLWLELNETDFSSDIPLPFRGLSGKIRWTGKDLFFEDVQAVLHGWSTKISGAFKNQDGDPAVRLRIKVGNKEKKWFEGGFFLDLNAHRIEGEIDFGQEQRYFFEGTARSEGRFFVMEPLTINGDYQGKGEIDFFSGNYELSVEKDSKRISVASNLKGLDFAIRGKLDHLKLLGLDIVTQGRIYIHAVQQRWSERQFFSKEI